MKRKNLLFILLFICCGRQVMAQCNAAFSSNVNNANVVFTAASSSPQLYHTWIFGDGSMVAYPTTNNIATHSYSPGTYTVLHFIKDSLTNCMDSVSSVINVQYIDSCQANFAVIETGHYPWGNEYVFVNNSHTNSPVVSLTWSVNGLAAGATYLSYFPAAQFRVCLTVTSATGCTSTLCKDVMVVQPQHCDWQASFTATPSPADHRKVNFAAQPVLPSAKYSWDFGDGNGSTDNSPTHIYSGFGNYHVTLKIRDTASNCIDSAIHNITVQSTQPDSCYVTFSYTTNSQGVTQFFPVTGNHVNSYSWWIDSTLFTSQSPLYSFTDTLPHFVCLTVTTDSGCVAHSCQYISIYNLAEGRVSGERLTAYPNPAMSGDVRFNIGLNRSATIIYKVYTAAGLPVTTGQQRGIQGNNNVRIPIDNLQPGQYFVELIYNDQRKRSIFIKL